jgi:hypothetical protein
VKRKEPSFGALRPRGFGTMHSTVLPHANGRRSPLSFVESGFEPIKEGLKAD